MHIIKQGLQQKLALFAQVHLVVSEFDSANAQHNLSNPALLLHLHLPFDMFVRAHATGTVGIGADAHSKGAREFLSNSPPRGCVRKLPQWEKDARHFSCTLDSRYHEPHSDTKRKILCFCVHMPASDRLRVPPIVLASVLLFLARERARTCALSRPHTDPRQPCHE